MTTRLYLASLFLVAAQCLVVADLRAQSAFPGGWVGRWKGTLEWYQGVNKREPVQMELHVLPADSADHYSWRLIYGEGQKDNRPYLLKPFDKSKGHWLIDEKNSIVLDQFFIGGRFFGSFTVGGNTITNSYWLSGDSLVVEFYNIQEKPIAVTGGRDSTVPKVKSYGVRSYQRAVLRRQ
ncbi:hypothetical protein [Flavihumibacter solisilvae]|uniref:Lipocalin-like domain-containing protein n=1 Tax=Flavihumibacter solisilvae TaxID=1349421 RepID=A0A0C1LHC4_9BACT|nr:hypothetical protein [Flavihumibacter solisilvae]KIC94713.1 hypothetical protein OI18_09500 [Flavihumibacter solisilvae]